MSPFPQRLKPLTPWFMYRNFKKIITGCKCVRGRAAVQRVKLKHYILDTAIWCQPTQLQETKCGNLPQSHRLQQVQALSFAPLLKCNSSLTNRLLWRGAECVYFSPWNVFPPLLPVGRKHPEATFTLHVAGFEWSDVVCSWRCDLTPALVLPWVGTERKEKGKKGTFWWKNTQQLK